MIYIFGATGYIGRYLCSYLKDNHFDFIALGRSRKVQSFFEKYEIPFCYFDLNDFSESEKRIHPVADDVFVNLSACLAEHETPVEDFFRINTIGTYKILDYAVRCGVKKYIMTTSHKVYNDVQGFTGKAIPENVELSYKGDHTPYIISKIAAENFVTYYKKDFGVNGICLRLTGVHGYGEILGHLNVDGTYKKSTFELFFEKALRGERIEVWGDQQVKRDHIYIKDVVKAIVAAIKSDNVSGIFNIASGVAYSQYEEACALAKVFGGKNRSEVVCIPEKSGLTHSYLYDIRKAAEYLDWHPEFADLEKMLEDYKMEWMSKKFHHYHFIKEDEKPLTC